VGLFKAIELADRIAEGQYDNRAPKATKRSQEQAEQDAIWKALEAKAQAGGAA
jgi:hypothetical protein